MTHDFLIKNATSSIESHIAQLLDSIDLLIVNPEFTEVVHWNVTVYITRVERDARLPKPINK